MSWWHPHFSQSLSDPKTDPHNNVRTKTHAHAHTHIHTHTQTAKILWVFLLRNVNGVWKVFLSINFLAFLWCTELGTWRNCRKNLVLLGIAQVRALSTEIEKQAYNFKGKGGHYDSFSYHSRNFHKYSKTISFAFGESIQNLHHWHRRRLSIDTYIRFKTETLK